MNAAAQYETEKILAELPDRISDVIRPFARENPDHPALVQGNITWSYSELDARVNRIAHCLVGRGAGRGALVGICMPRGRDLLAAVLAVLKAGPGYVPLDPSYPRDRLEHMVRDSGLRMIVNCGPSHNSERPTSWRKSGESGLWRSVHTRPALLTTRDSLWASETRPWRPKKPTSPLWKSALEWGVCW